MIVGLHSSNTYFFFNDTATTEIYTLSLHDALPILLPNWHHRYGSWPATSSEGYFEFEVDGVTIVGYIDRIGDRKSTRLNSSHANISYAVFCLKKKKKNFMSIKFTSSNYYTTHSYNS